MIGYSQKILHSLLFLCLFWSYLELSSIIKNHYSKNNQYNLKLLLNYYTIYFLSLPTYSLFMIIKYGQYHLFYFLLFIFHFFLFFRFYYYFIYSFFYVTYIWLKIIKYGQQLNFGFFYKLINISLFWFKIGFQVCLIACFYLLYGSINSLPFHD